jgi:predicted nucleotidyltransferase
MTPFTEKRFLQKRTATPAERERLAQAIKDRLLAEPDVVFAYLHGSFVTEESFRDIDVGIFTGNAKDFSFESDLSFELSKALGHEVEVRVINDAPVAFQMEVLSKGNPLMSRNDDTRTDFIEDVGRRYREYSHFRNVFMEAVGGEQ